MLEQSQAQLKGCLLVHSKGTCKNVRKAITIELSAPITCGMKKGEEVGKHWQLLLLEDIRVESCIDHQTKQSTRKQWP